MAQIVTQFISGIFFESLWWNSYFKKFKGNLNNVVENGVHTGEPTKITSNKKKLTKRKRNCNRNCFNYIQVHTKIIIVIKLGDIKITQKGLISIP